MSYFFANQEHQMKRFPCNMCLVKACCVDPCELPTKDKDRIFKMLVQQKLCPDCGNKKLERIGATFCCLECDSEFHLEVGCLGRRTGKRGGYDRDLQ